MAIGTIILILILSGMFLALPGMHLLRLRLTRVYPPTTQFSVAVLVPCKGDDDPDFENNLLNIVQQEYAGHMEVIFCVESEEDSAVPTLRKLAHAYQHVQMCIAGFSTQCAQKTHNILKGMECASDVEIFVIADADIQPHSTWLQELVAPFTDEQVGAATGFFRRVPVVSHFRIGDYLAGFFSSIIMTGISNDSLKSLWGGSLAVRKAVMDEYQLYERFSTEIVDDVALMHALHQHKLTRRYVQSCTLKSYCDMSIRESVEWFVRQIQFLQIYFRTLHAFFLSAIMLYNLVVFGSPFLIAYGVLHGDGVLVGVVALFWVLMMLTGYWLFIGIPGNRQPARDGKRYRIGYWLLITPLGFFLGGVAMVKTLLRVRGGVLRMRWRSIDYYVDIATGRVMEVIR